jgi:Tol biopolymer transport system component/DNA-binding winged helix-turn-helix (wHTH) protein
MPKIRAYLAISAAILHPPGETQVAATVFEFGEFKLDSARFELTRAGRTLKLERKPLELLLLFVARNGDLVSRAEIAQRLWGSEVFVDTEHGINTAVRKIRQALRDDSEEPRYVQTVTAKGYRFIGTLVPMEAAPEVISRNGNIRAPQESSDIHSEPPIFVAPAGPTASRRSRLWIGLVASAALALLVLAVVAGFLLRPVIRDRASAASHSAAASTNFAPMRVTPLTYLPGWARFPALSPDGEKLAFLWNNETPKMDLYVQLVGGDRPLQLTHTHSGFLCCTSWSPDGREIAFGRCDDHGGAVYIVPALGGPERKLTDVVCPFGHAGFPKWTSDGQWLVLADQCTPGGPPGIVRFSLATGEKQCLHAPPASDVGDSGLALSPDQKTVAFLKVPNADMMELYTVPLSGGPVRQMTSDGHGIGTLMWSADGRRIVFDSGRNGSDRVWQVPETGGGIQPELEYPGVGSLSRDGRRLAYEGSSGLSGCSSTIWRADLSRPGGSVPSLARVLTSPGFNSGTQVSADGRQIALQSSRSGRGQIWKSDVDGSNPLQMTFFDKGFPGTPRWSPDDRWIAFDYHDPRHTEIYLVDSEGRNLRRITSGNYENVVPSWSRDGAFIYFASNRTGGWQVWKHALATGQETQVTRNGGFAAIESYDAKTLYHSKFEGGGIWSVPPNGGEERHLTEALHLGDWGNFTVTETGLYLVDSSTEPGPTILYYNFQNRRMNPVIMLKQNALEGTSNLSSSRDGRTIVYAQHECKGSILMAEKVP